MTPRFLRRSRLVGFALFSLAATPAWAQTVAPGPYYATPSWDQTLPCTSPSTCPRFIVLSNFGGEAVLDRETGLVWEREPLHPAPMELETGRRNRADALEHCATKTVGKRLGWRLPSLQELASLVDAAGGDAFGRLLPPGHPFIGIEDSYYWSATTQPPSHARAGVVRLVGLPSAGFFPLQAAAIEFQHFVWCVRGNEGVDPR